MNNIVFLVSGNGGTLKFIYEAIKVFRLNIKIKAVISDRDCGATNFSIKNNIPTHKIAVEKNNVNIKNTKAIVKKTMTNNPRRIEKIEINLLFPENYDSKTKIILERAAYNCPVHNSLSEKLANNEWSSAGKITLRIQFGVFSTEFFCATSKDFFCPAKVAEEI